MVGVIAAVLGAAIFVVFRTSTDSGGRMKNAKAEQTLGLWLPFDLASADSLDTKPGSEPCNGGCPAGSYPPSTNVLQVGWPRLALTQNDSSSSWVNVSYRYAGSGTQYQVLRVVCTGVTAWTCTSKVVLPNVAAPPAGTNFTHGSQPPTWVMRVSEPLDPASTDSTTPAPATETKGAKRVVVSVNGGGTGSSREGGWKDIALTMGSTDRGTLEPEELAANPTITQLRSRCGGNIGLLIDKSLSLGDVGIAAVKDGVNRFIDAFAGTPVKLQVITFNHLATTLGGTWPHWFDMSDESQVQQLRNEINALSTYYGTNWEDGLFRMLKNPDGTNQAVLPQKVVMFTDGVPTYDRLTINPHWGNIPANSGLPGTELTPPKNPYLPSADWRLGIPPARNWWFFVQETFDRANYIAAQFRNKVEFIGVGVGPDFTKSSQWTDVAADGTLSYTDVPNSVILSRLISGTDYGVPAVEQNGVYTNANVANMYTLPQWSQFAAAIEAVALAQCGGTLTVRTFENGGASQRSITYQKRQILNSSGNPLTNDGSVVTTSPDFPAGTFDFSIPDGNYVTVEIRPIITPELAGVTPVAWTCRARGSDRSVTTVPIDGSPLTGVRVRVGANEAVSCRLEVKGP